MTITTTQCIHGFPIEQCVSCRTCEHGQPITSCARCRAPATTRRIPEPIGDLSTHEHDGHEIFFDPAVSGWRYRAPDDAASQLSYRSAFLARKAVDERQRTGADASSAPKRKRRKT